LTPQECRKAEQKAVVSAMRVNLALLLGLLSLLAGNAFAGVISFARLSSWSTGACTTRFQFLNPGTNLHEVIKIDKSDLISASTAASLITKLSLTMLCRHPESLSSD